MRFSVFKEGSGTKVDFDGACERLGEAFNVTEISEDRTGDITSVVVSADGGGRPVSGMGAGTLVISCTL